MPGRACAYFNRSLIQPIEGDLDLWTDRNQNALDQPAVTEIRHPASDCRAADVKFTRNAFPVRSGESCLRIDPLLESWARGQIDPRDPITRECYEGIEQLAKEAADLASKWDVEHNFSHFFDDDWEDESPQTPRT